MSIALVPVAEEAVGVRVAAVAEVNRDRVREGPPTAMRGVHEEQAPFTGQRSFVIFDASGTRVFESTMSVVLVDAQYLAELGRISARVNGIPLQLLG